MTDNTENQDQSRLHPMWSSHQERASHVADLTQSYAGPDPDGEGFLEKTARLNTAHNRAEEAVRQEEAQASSEETTLS